MNWWTFLTIGLLIAPLVLWWWVTIDGQQDECACGHAQMSTPGHDYYSCEVDA